MFIGEILDLDLSNVTVNLPETEAPAYSAGATYNIGAEVIYDHKVYGCLMDGTTGKQPDTHSNKLQTPQYWQLKGATNAYACLDGTLSTPTVNEGSIVLTIDGFANIAAVGMFDAYGDQAVAKFYDATGALLDAQTVTVSGYDYASHYALMFTPPSGAATNHLFRAFPVSAVKVVLTISGGSTKLGEVAVLQNGYNYGSALMGTNVRIASRSVYEDDEFGQPRFVYRPARVHTTFQLHGERAYIDSIWGQMRALSGRRVAYEAARDRVITTGAGLVRDTGVPVELPNDYVYSLEIEGVQ